MKFLRSLVWSLALALALAPSLRAEPAVTDKVMASSDAHGGHFVKPEIFDWKKILPPPPAPDSIAAQADLETVLHVQDSRTPEQVAWAQFILEDDVFKNARVLGPWFTAANLPFTAEFFKQIDDDGAAAVNNLKKLYPRPRPPRTDTRVHPCIPVPKSGSYPSGHSSQAWMWAEILAQIFPEKQAELYDRARAVMWGRVIGGAHFPSDTAAGELVGRTVAREMLKNPALRAALEKCRAEAAPFLLRKAA